MASYSASIDLQVRADRALAQIGKVEQAINRLSGIGSAGKEFKEALVPDTKQLGRLGKELDAIKNRANSTAKVFARLFEGVGTAGVTAAGLEAINAKMFELAASTGTAAASIQALDKNTGDLSRFIPGFTLLKDSVNASAFEVNKLQYGLQQFLSNTEGIREFVQNFYTMDGAAGAATAGLLALAGVLEGQLRQNLGDIEQAGNKAFKGLQEDIANNTSELNRLINATRGTADQYRNLIRLGEERRDSYNSSSREARQAINTVVRAEEKLTDELRAQADLKRAAKGVTVTELEAAKGRKSIETRQKAEAYRTEQTRLREQEEKAVQDTVDALKQQRVQESAVTEEVAQRTRELNNQVRLRASILQKIQDVRSARAVRERSAFLQGDPQAYERPAGPGGAFRFPQADAIQAAVREQQNFNALQEEARKKAQSNLELQYNWAKALGQRAEIAKELRDVAAADLNNQKQAAKAEERRLRLARRRADVIRAREKAERTKRAVGEGIIGGAFPLLFGQGLGASVGGGFGGAAGGLIGGQFGFGLSLVGTALGSSFDALVKDAAELGAALDSVTGDANAAAKAAGLTGTDLGRLIEKLEQAGDKTQAMALATQELEEIVGKQGVKALRDFSATAEQMGRDLEALSTRIKALFAGIANVVFPPETTKRIEETKAIERARRSTDPRIQQAVKDYFDESNFEGLGLKEGVDARLAARQKILDLVKQEQDEMLRIRSLTEDVAQKEREKTAENETSLSIARARLIVEKNNGDILNATVEASLRAIAAEETRLKLVKAAGDARLIELALIEAGTRKAEIDNQIKAAREALARKTARAEGKAAESKALSLQRDIFRERLNLFTIDEKIARVGLDRLGILQREEQAILIRRDTEIELLEFARQDALNRNKVKEDEALINELYDARLLKITKSADLAAKENALAQERLRAERQIADLRAAAGFDPLALAERTQPYGMYGAPEQLMDFSTGAEINAIVKQEIALERVLEKYQQIGQAAQLTSELVTTGFQDMLTGTKSAEEVFANFLRNMAEILIKTAQQMIAQYIAIGIARAFALGQSPAVGTRASDFNLPGFGNLGPDAGSGISGFLAGGSGILGRAKGGPVSTGTPYMVGERGPELFVPSNSGTIVPNNALGGDVNVVVNVTETQTDTRGDGARAKQVGNALAAAVQAEIIKQKRPGGLLAN